MKDMTPEEMAELFSKMTQYEQTRFFNYLSILDDGFLSYRIRLIGECSRLTKGGKRIMQTIGKYSDEQG